MTGYQMALRLFKIHTHAELCKPEEIVYTERDVVNLLKELGLPEPDWQMLGTVSRFWKGKIPEENINEEDVELYIQFKKGVDNE